MNKKSILLIVLALTAALILFLLPSDEKKVRANLDALAGHCSTTPGEATMATIKKVALAGKLFTVPCKVEIESFDLSRSFSRKELTDYLLMMKRMLPDARFTFHDTIVSFPDEGKRAEVVTTLRLTGNIDSSRFTDAYELNISSEKRDGDWLFSSFTVIEFMEQ